jgi:alpha-L-fucosidase 2
VFQSSRSLCTLAAQAAALLALALLSVNAGASADTPTGKYEVKENIEYRHDPEPLLLDAHIPVGKGPFPAVILVHGGGWVGGTKTADFVRPLFDTLDKTGYAWFTIDYRLAPKYPYPAAAEDVESAIVWVKEHAREYRVNPKKIVLMGESAGGHLVNLVGARNRKPADVAAVVSFYGPIDLLKLFKIDEDQRGPAPAGLQSGFFQFKQLDDAAMATLKDASPHTHLSPKSPPFLFIQGTKDAAVPYTQALLALELVHKVGVPCDLITVEDGIHGVINWEKDPKFQGYKAELIDWLHRTLK